MTRGRNAQAFLAGTATGELRLRVCRACGTIASPELAVCPNCGSPDADDRAASGSASLVSWTIAHSRPAEDGSTAIRVIAIGELAEGVWWWADLEGADPAVLAVGDTLELGWRTSEIGMIPVFRWPSDPTSPDILDARDKN